MKASINDIFSKGISDELYAARAFIHLACHLKDLQLQQKFLQYAQEELQHAEKLLALYSETSKEGLVVEEKALPKVDTILEFLVEYKAEEDAAVHYYETLETLFTDTETHAFFKTIAHEEATHLKTIDALLKAVLEKEGTNHGE